MAADEDTRKKEGEAAPPGSGLDPTDIQRTDLEVDAEETGDEDASIEVTVEDAGPCEKRVSVEVPAETVSEEIRTNLDNLKTAMPVRGFRKGRIPRNLLERRYGKQVREEVRASLMSRGVSKALKDGNLEPLSYPEVDEEGVTLEEGEPLRFTFTLDVRPEVEVKDYVGLSVSQPAVSVTDEEVEREMEHLRRRFGTLEPVEDGASRRGDRLVVTLEYFHDGSSVHRAENVSLALPEDEASAIYEQSPWVAEAVGRTAGTSYEADTEFTQEFPVEAVRGEKGRVSVTVEEVKRLRLPDWGKEIFEALQVEDEKELRERVAARIREARASQARSVVEKRLLEQLLEKTPVEMPERVIERSLESQARKAELRLRESSVPEEEIPEKLEQMRRDRREEMTREYKSFFLVEEIAKKEKIYVTEDDVRARVELLAYNYGKWPQQMEKELEERGMMDELRASLREEKVLAFLREKAEITEEPEEKGAEGGA